MWIMHVYCVEQTDSRSICKDCVQRHEHLAIAMCCGARVDVCMHMRPWCAMCVCVHVFMCVYVCVYVYVCACV
jgi:hypothetical protein